MKTELETQLCISLPFNFNWILTRINTSSYIRLFWGHSHRSFLVGGGCGGDAENIEDNAVKIQRNNGTFLVRGSRARTRPHPADCSCTLITASDLNLPTGH